MEAKDEKVNAPVPNTELTQSREPKKDELSDVDKELLKLHIAEYQMLSARATTGLVGQVQAASILLAALALFANAKDLNPFPKAATIWIGLLFAQMIGIFYSNGMIDTFKTILYLETAIRPAVQKLVGQKGTFWEYEQHLARQRGSGLIFHEITIPILAAASFALACIVRFKFTTNEPVNVVDGILIGLNLAATTVIVKWSHKSASIRRKWTDTENQAGKGIS